VPFAVGSIVGTWPVPPAVEPLEEPLDEPLEEPLPEPLLEGFEPLDPPELVPELDEPLDEPLLDVSPLDDPPLLVEPPPDEPPLELVPIWSGLFWPNDVPGEPLPHPAAKARATRVASESPERKLMSAILSSARISTRRGRGRLSPMQRRRTSTESLKSFF
jgi:hypothetical protein